LVRAGVTPLELSLALHVAARGEQCWETDNAVREYLRRPNDGRHYHRESIGRARRHLTRRGLIGAKRLMPRMTLPSGERTSCGTTTKWINWKKLGVRNPLTKAERREARTHERVVRRGRRTHDVIDPGFAAMVGGIGNQLPPRRPGPTPPTMPRETPAEAKARLAAWSRDNEPPD
jgi:hypothetical protein